MTARGFVQVAALACAGLLVAACDDDSNVDPTGTSAATGGQATSAGGTGGGPSGVGGAGGEPSGVGGGGGTSPCLESARYEAVFTLEHAELCVEATFTAPFEVGYAITPKWGRHGGPVTLVQIFDGVNPTDEVTITRWSVPVSPEDTLVALETLGPLSLGVGTQAVGPFVSPAVIDLPLSSWSLVGWTGASSVGEIVALDGATVADRWANVGFFDGATVDDGTVARLVHTGQSELEDGDAGGAACGVYAADFCSGPALCATEPTVTVATWGLANGPLARDTSGHIFALNTDYLEETQELRAFHASDMAPGQAGESGTELFTLAGYGSTLAVIDAAPGEDGIVLFQPVEGLTPQAVIAQRFRVTGNAVAGQGTPSTALTLVGGEAITLMNDDSGRVWLGVPSSGQTRFFVLTRRP